MIPIFPWSAVIGQERLKLALLLSAIDPGIGGVLVRGPRGVAKTTLARAFAELLPGRFVELPLGATEERVVGSLDLGKALGQGELHFSPGLLARAHDGVLYVDEVNLLPDALVDLLLDAAASGQNVVERDGVSHVHPARFVLVGTMNPEEGELRPQLLDRFGLSVSADARSSPDERSQIVLRRLDFERDPVTFAARFERDQRDILQRCQRARARAQEIPFEGPAVTRAAELCHAAGVEGVRADLAMLRAARAHAAWRDDTRIATSDVDDVAELALAHRRRGPPGTRGGPPEGTGGGRTPSSTESRPSSRSPDSFEAKSGHSRTTSRGGAPRPGPDDTSRNAPGTADTRDPCHAEADPRCASPDDTSGARGALPPVPVRALETPPLPPWITAPPRPNPRHVQDPLRPTQRRRRGARVATGHGTIDWPATLLQGLRRARSNTARTSPVVRPTLADVRRRPRKLAGGDLWVLAIDRSASMLKSGALAAAKGLTAALAAEARRTGARAVVVSFGAGDTRIDADTQRRGHAIEHAIAALDAGGSTPLRAAVRLALDLCHTARAQGTPSRLYLLTDGRTRETLDDLTPTAQDINTLIIDCERGPLRLARARRSAEALRAHYIHIDTLRDPRNQTAPS